MPAGSPNTRALYESQGITVIEAPIDQYLRAAGGMGCLTGVLRRG
jgi:N-dimethylarginine dimethylaminohydrolase